MALARRDGSAASAGLRRRGGPCTKSKRPPGRPPPPSRRRGHRPAPPEGGMWDVDVGCGMWMWDVGCGCGMWDVGWDGVRHSKRDVCVGHAVGQQDTRHVLQFGLVEFLLKSGSIFAYPYL